MPDLGAILNTVPKLAGASVEQRQQILSQVYDGLKSSGQLTSEKLRQFRNDQMSTFLREDGGDVQPDSGKTTYDAMGNPLTGPGGYASDKTLKNIPEAANLPGQLDQERARSADLGSQLFRRNVLEELRDLGRVATDGSAIWTSLKKTGQDLLGLGLSAFVARGIMDEAGFQLTNKETGQKFRPSFTEALDKFNQMDAVKALNAEYKEAIKDDPELAKRVHAVFTDAAVGSLFGAGRVARTLAEPGVVKTGLSKLREFFAPVVSNVVGGQAIITGMEGLDKVLEKTALSDEVKTGARLGSLLLLAGASAMGPERWLENVVAGRGGAPELASKLGTVAKQAEASGESFKDALARNPDLSNEARQVLGIQTQVDPTTGQILNLTVLEDSADKVSEALRKMAANQELSAEEAAMIKALNPQAIINPLKPEEAAADLGALSSQPLALPYVAPDTVAGLTSRIDALTTGGRSTKAAMNQATESGDTLVADHLKQQIGSVRSWTSDIEKELANNPDALKEILENTNRELEEFASRGSAVRKVYDAEEDLVVRSVMDEQLSVLRSDYQRLKDRKRVLERIKAKPAPKASQPAEKTNVDTALLALPPGSIRVDSTASPLDKAVSALDSLTTNGRATQEALKDAIARGDTLMAAHLRQQVKSIKGWTADVQKAFVEDVRTTRGMVNQVSDEISNIDAQLAGLRQSYKSTTSPLRQAEIAERGEALKSTVQKLQDRRTVLTRALAEAKKAQAPSPTPKPAPKPATPEVSWDTIPVSRRALESLDILTSDARTMQARLARAEASGNPNAVMGVKESLKSIKSRVADMQKVIALETKGSRDLLKLVEKDIKDIDGQLSGLRDEWRATELTVRKAELEEKAAALKKVRQKMADRQTVIKRIPKKLGSDALERIQDERLADVFTRKAKPSRPWKPKIDVRDPETVLSELPETERLRAMKVAQAARIGTEDILGRQLTEPERLDLLADVLHERRNWSENPFPPSESPTTFGPFGDIMVPAGYVGEKYPLASKVLRMLSPEVADTGVYTPDQVLQLAQALTARSGLGMDATGWQLSRDIVSESYHLWDDVRNNLAYRGGDNLLSFLTKAMPNSKPGTVKKIATTINRAFPELDLSFTADALPHGVAATADALSKMVTVGLGKVELKELMHEIGHLNFWHGVDADTRLSWMDEMRAHTTDEVSWANRFPEYAERQMANTQMDEAARANSEFWMQNPSEMYAQQFSAYTLSNVLPTVETLGTFQRAWRGLKHTMGLAADEWDTLPVDTKQAILKTLTSPEPSEARLIPSAEIEEGLKKNWLYSDRETAEARVLEFRSMLETTYGQRTAPMPTSETEILDVAQNVPQASFFSLPVEQRVASYALDDLPNVAEMQALNLLYDLPGASFEELRGCLQRLNDTLSGDRRADLLDSIVVSKQKEASKFDPNFNPMYGNYRSPGEIAAENMGSAINEYNRLDRASKNAIAADNARKYKREWMRRKTAAAQALDEEVAAGSRSSYTDKDVEALADTIWNERPATTLEGNAMAIYRGMNETQTTTEKLYAQAEKQLAVLDTKKDNLVDFTKYVLASRGMSQMIDGSFTQRLSRAELYSRIASGSSKWPWPSLAWRVGVQGAYIGLTGLEYDPNGTKIPFLGTVRWSPERFLSSAPLGVFLLPGGFSGMRWLGKQSSKITKPMVDKVVGRIPLSTRLKVAKLGKTLKWAFMNANGLTPELQRGMRESQIFAQSKKQDFYAFAETMVRHFSREEREVIAKIYEEQPGIEQLLFDVAENRPDILEAVNMVRHLYSHIGEEFKAIGLWSPHFEDLGDHYLNRVYDGLGNKPISAVFYDAGIAPVRGDFLKRRGIEATIKNGNTAEAGKSSIDSLKQLRNNAKEANLEIEEGLKLNAWEAPDGTVIYSIPKTAYDDSLRAQKLPALHQWDKDGTGFIVTEVRKNSLKVRRDYTLKEREGMGEVVDVATRSAVMGENLERDLRQGRAFYNIANSSYAKRAADQAEADALIEQGWTLVEDSVNKQTGLQKFGALAGMYIHPDAKAALTMLSSNKFADWLSALPGGEGFLKVHKAMLNGWKLSKTVLTPIAHMNNFVSNLFMGYLMGHNSVSDLTTGLHMSKLRNMDIQAKELIKSGKVKEATDIYDKMMDDKYYGYFVEMRQARMADSSLWATELNSNTLLEELRRENLQGSQSELGLIQRVLSKGYETVQKGWDATTNWAGKWYEKGDLLYKMGAFVNARKSGRSTNDAVKYAYEAYFDYGNLSPLAKIAKDSGMVPFVSYLYNAIPALGKALTQHPDRIAAVGVMLEAMHLASISSVYGPDEVIAKKEAVDAAMPEYMRKRQFGGLFRTRILNPFASEANLDTPKGNVAKHQFLDISRMVPGSDLYDTNSGISDIDFSLATPGELLFKFINQSPLISTAVAIGSGRHPTLGYSLMEGGNLDEEAVKERRLSKVADLLISTIAPNLPFIPGTPTYNAITDAIKPLAGFEWGQNNGLDAMGLPKSLGTAVAGSFGVKFRDVYPEVNLTAQLESTDMQLQKEKGRLTKIFERQTNTAKYLEGELKGFEKTAQETMKKQARRAELLQRLSDARREAQGGRTLPH